jgi:5-methylcytosine-specific restriction endonuclease McrA
MADDHRSVPSSSPQLVQDILDQVREVERDCSFYLFPAIRRHAKSRAERRYILEVRLAVYERSGGRCELRLSPKCWEWISWSTMHSAHVKSRGAGGQWTLTNLKAACPECHGFQHAGGKVCPEK